MNTNPNIQPVIPAGQANVNQPPSNPFQGNDFTFDLDPDTGEMIGARIQPQGQQGSELIDSNPVNLQPANPVNNADDPWRQNIEGAITRLAMFVEGMANGTQRQGNQQVQAPSAPELKLDFQSDTFANDLVTLINQTIDKRMGGFEDKLTPISQNLNQVNDRMQLTDLAIKYGPDFMQKLPMILEYRKGDPTANAEKLYMMLKAASPKTDGTTQTPNGNQQVQPQVDQALQQRANQLATERNSITNSPNNNGKPSKMTILQAIDDAIASTYSPS